MKKQLKVFLFLIAFGLFSFLITKIIVRINHRNEVTKNIKKIPAFSFQDINGVLFNNRNLKKNTATIFVYFNTECEFCNSEAKIIQENRSKLNNVELVFVSFENPEKIKSFAIEHQLITYNNIHFLYDKQVSFASTFDVVGLPTIVIYDKKNQLIEKIKGQVKINHILRTLNKPWQN